MTAVTTQADQADAPYLSLLPPTPPEAPPQPAVNSYGSDDGSDSPAGPDVGPEVQPATVSSPRRHATTIAVTSGAFILGVVVGIALPAGGSGSSNGAAEHSASPSPTAASGIQDAYDACGAESAGALIADEASTLIIDTQGDDDTDGVDYETVGCLLAELDTPERVTQTMNSTRALDGRVTDSWDSFTASWSYHPDTGLDLVISTP